MRLFNVIIIIGIFFLNCAGASSVRKEQGNTIELAISPESHLDQELELPKSNLDRALDNLTSQIVSSMTETGKKKIAVVEFSNLEGRVTTFGMYIAEELITRLFMTNKFEVVERQLLNEILAEQQLSASGLMDEESVQKLGKILGVDALVTGTITDLLENLKVNARLISTETGSIFSVSSVRIYKDEVVSNLISKVKLVDDEYSQTSSTFADSTESLLISCGSNPPKGYFYYEDFNEVRKGTIPEGWIGGEAMGVVNGKNGEMEIRNYEVRSDLSIQTCDIPFPSKFELEIIFWWDYGFINVVLGDLVINLRDAGQVNIGKSSIDLHQRLENKLLVLTIQRDDNVYIFKINHNEVLARRYNSLNFNSISFNNRVGRWPTRTLGINRITGKFIQP